MTSSSTNAVFLTTGNSSTQAATSGGGSTFLINLPTQTVANFNTSNNDGVAIGQRQNFHLVTSTLSFPVAGCSTTTTTAGGGRIGNTFVLFPVKPLQQQRKVIVEKSAKTTPTVVKPIQPAIPESQKAQILSLAIQNNIAGIQNSSQQRYTPVFLVSTNSTNSCNSAFPKLVPNFGCATTSNSDNNVATCHVTCDRKYSNFDDDQSPLDMGTKKESLKRKLMQRRPIRELVARGILPARNTPPSFYEQRLKLERAKMGDILKHKIEHRPNKQQLVSQHILLDSSADPSIVDKLQQLKKCKLADSLNEKLAHRPGPLELVQENILHVDAALEQAVKDGRLQFKPTSAGLIQKHPHPVFSLQESTITTCGAKSASPQQDEGNTVAVEGRSSGTGFSTSGDSSNNNNNTTDFTNGFIDFSQLSSPRSSSPMLLSPQSSVMITTTNNANDLHHFHNHLINGKDIVIATTTPASTTAVVENLQTSKSKPKKSKSKFSSPSSASAVATTSSSQVLVNSSTGLSASGANCSNNIISPTTTTANCILNNSVSFGGGSVVGGASIAAAATPNVSYISSTSSTPSCLSLAQSQINNPNLPKAKIIKFHEYKGPGCGGPPGSLQLGQKSPLNFLPPGGAVASKLLIVPNGGANGGGTFSSPFLVDCNGLLEAKHQQQLNSLQSVMMVRNNGLGGAASGGDQPNSGMAEFAENSATSTTPPAQFAADNFNKSETSYELLLQQQQLMLQWQLELQQKYPNTTVHLVPSSNVMTNGSSTDIFFAGDILEASLMHQQQQQQQNCLWPPTQQQTTNVVQHMQVQQNDSPTQNGWTHQNNMDAISSVQSSPGLNAGCQQAYTVSSQNATSSTSSSLPQTPAPLLRSESDTAAAGLIQHSSVTSTANGKSSTGQNSAGAANKPVEKLEDMKVNDLKAECKKRNLPVSGSKPHLLERLKPYEDVILTSLKERLNLHNISDVTASDNSKNPIAALPPISFLSNSTSSANLNMNMFTKQQQDENTNIFLQTSPSGGEIASDAFLNAGGVSNGHSLSSVDHSQAASNYSSPGIDLSTLSFNSNNTPNSNNHNNGNLSGGMSNFGQVNNVFTFSTPTFVDNSQRNVNATVLDTNCSTFGATDHTVHLVNSGASGYDAILPVHSLVGVTENQFQHQPQQQSVDSNEQRVPILSLHEDMLRGQQRKIEELQRELQRSQDVLKQQQQLILAAKKVQAEAGEQGGAGGSGSDNILNQLDTKQMQKMHIQLFLQQKLQQQQLQQQLNVQRELVATQQRLEEEMQVHQAVTEVVRLLRQEPRISLLVLHLLKKHQLEQQQQQLQQQHQQQQQQQQQQQPQVVEDQNVTPAMVAPQTTATATTALSAKGGKNNNACGNDAALSATVGNVVSSLSAQSSPKHVAPKKHSSSSVNGESTVTKHKTGGNSKKSSLQHTNNSNSNPSSNHNNSNNGTSASSTLSATPAASTSSAPKTPKPVGTIPIDMEEIFRTVLDYASKATSTALVKRSPGDSEAMDSDGQTTGIEKNSQISVPFALDVSSDNIPVASEMLPGASVPSAGVPTATLPGCDQIMSQRRAVSENENNAGGENLRHLFHPFDQNHRMTSSPDGPFVYTKNEAFDDLMEVLRNNSAPGQAGGATPMFCNASGTIVMMPNANVVDHRSNNNNDQIRQAVVTTDSSSTTPVAVTQHGSSCATTGGATFVNTFSAQDMADLLSSDWFNVDSVLNAGGCINVGFDSTQTSQCISTPNSYSLDKNSSKPDTQLRITPMDSMFSNNVDCSEQMDWLDLILPSPNVDLPANPPCPLSGEMPGGGRHSSQSSHTPMETDSSNLNLSIESLITCRRDPMLLTRNSSTTNPVLAMSGDCL